MLPNCSRWARWRICTWRGKNCCSWHRLSPGAKVADHGRAAQAGGRPEKNRIRALAPAWQNTYYLEDTGLFRVSLILHPGYAEYMRGTGMFLPGNPGGHVFTLLFGGMRNRSLAHRLAIGSLALVLLLAGIGLRAYTLGHISRSADAANMEVISVYPMTPDAMQHVVALALADSRVEEALHREPYATFVVHILPHNYGMIGMFADVESHHMRPGNIHLSRFKYLAGCLLPFLDVHQRTDLMGSEGREYRLVFSRVDGPGGSPVPPARIFDLSAKMTPVYVADVNSASGHLSETIDPPRRSFWGDVKMLIF